MLHIINAETIYRVAIGSSAAYNIKKRLYQNEIFLKGTLKHETNENQKET